MPFSNTRQNDRLLVVGVAQLDKLLEHLLHPSYAGIGHSAVVVDGFPRTPFQVDLCKILYDKLVVSCENEPDPCQGRRTLLL